MNKTELSVIGGFLGSGKTTSILSIAKHLISNGKKVGIVTNDQGKDLVDTNFLIKSGLPVLEVTGGCFCCNFEEFTSKVNELSENLMPDIILAEPVGSCTDLIATIFKPIQANYTKQFSLAPLSIVADPKRVKTFMMERDSHFSSEIDYLFQKQLEEADIIVLNKIDTITARDADNMVSFLKERYKGIDVIMVSAKHSKGIERWTSLIGSTNFSFKPSLDIDYSSYAHAEEQLGWLNSSALVASDELHDANQFIMTLMETIKRKLSSCSIEIAHLKVYEVSGSDFTKACLTSIYEDVEYNKLMSNKIKEAHLFVNARVNTSPDILRPIVDSALKEASIQQGIVLSKVDIQCFRPGKPNPTFRL